MARPRKGNADYFSHDNNMRNDDRIRVLRKKFGTHTGYAVWCMFLEKLCSKEGFKVNMRKIEIEILAIDFECDYELLENFISYCIQIELLQTKNEDGADYVFCKNLTERFSVLTEKRACDRVRISEKRLGLSKVVGSLSQVVAELSPRQSELSPRQSELSQVVAELSPRQSELSQVVADTLRAKKHSKAEHSKSEHRIEVSTSSLKNNSLIPNNYDDVLTPELEKIESLKPYMTEEHKLSSSSFSSLKRFLVGSGLLEDFNESSICLKNAHNDFLELMASLYTKTQKKAGDSMKYSRTVKKALLGQTKEPWNIQEVIQDVNNYIDFEFTKYIAKYSAEMELIEKEAKINEEVERKRDLLFTFNTLPPNTKKEIEELSIDQVSRRTGMRLKTNNPIIKNEIAKIIEDQGYQKNRMGEMEHV